MKKQYFKYFFDLAMGIVFSLLFRHTILGGQSFHEIAGTALGAAVIIHLVLNAAWIRNSLKVFRQKGNTRGKILWLIDFLTVLDFLLMIISGLAISKVLLPNLNLQNAVFSKPVHVGSAYLALLLIGIHVGMHWSWVMAMFRRLLHLGRSSKLTVGIARVLAAAVLVFGIFSLVNTGYGTKVAAMFTASGEGMGSGAGNLPADASHSDADTGTGKGQNGSGMGQKQGMAENGTGSSAGTAVTVSIQYLSIIGAFAAGEYYTEKLVSACGKKNQKTVG